MVAHAPRRFWHNKQNRLLFFVPCEELIFILAQGTIKDCCAEFLGEVDDKAQVVNRGKRACEHLMRTEEVREVGFCKIITGITIAVLLYGKKILAVASIAYIHLPLPRVERAVPGIPRWRHTVKEVAPLLHRKHNILRLADAKEVPRLILRQECVHPANCGVHIILSKGTPDAKTVKSASWWTYPANDPRTLFTQFLHSPSLHDAKK